MNNFIKARLLFSLNVFAKEHRMLKRQYLNFVHGGIVLFCCFFSHMFFLTISV